MQGGFAKCFLFTDLGANYHCAGKVVAKSTLKKERAKQKVRHRCSYRAPTQLTAPPAPRAALGQLLAEIKIHKSLDHERVVRFLHYFEDRHNVYIILELCHNRVRLPRRAPLHRTRIR